MKTTPIYDQTLSDLRNGVRRIIHQGGQWSGKTVNVLGALATVANEGNDGDVTTVTSMSMPHLKGGALRDFEQYVYPSFKACIKQYHRTDHIFTFNSGDIIEFKTFEDEQKARGAKRKRLFVNEANSMIPMLFFQLDSRSEQTIIDYNPSCRFFAHEDLIGHPGNKCYISDHRHNPFIPQSKHDEIESMCIRDPKTGVVLKGDYELWKVYARGLTGNIAGVIFPDWEMIDDDQFPTMFPDEYIFSIDFGYTVDPTAIIKQCRVGDTIFVKELSYRPGISPYEIYAILSANGWKDNMKVYCDHDPDMIRSLRISGVKYAEAARKPPGSIYTGIVNMKTYQWRYTASSANLHRERGLYVWDVDKITGKAINVPIERHNHCFDAIRYGFYTRYLRNQLKRA